VGGQHFTALAEESLKAYPDIDFVVRGEGEQTLAELVQTLGRKTPLSNVDGISFRNQGEIIHMPDRHLIENLDDLPFPGYHFVEEHARKYHFKMMVGEKRRIFSCRGIKGLSTPLRLLFTMEVLGRKMEDKNL
jgi:anaerobic magnesium-protoporphyrin IX monomethyl ester cyclase